VPIKIRAIQGHSAEALKGAGGLFANSTLIYCADNVSPERKAAFAGVPICDMTEVPSHDEEQLEEHRQKWSHSWRW
jgi:hypothetical protein